jgi:hypothetical protein
MDNSEWRPPSDYEREVMARLLSVEFPGVQELRTQLAACLVKTSGGYGTVKIQSKCPLAAKVVDRVPVEAVADDADGYGIHYLLHVIDGFAEELEVFTETLLDIIKTPDPSSLRVEVTSAIDPDLKKRFGIE